MTKPQVIQQIMHLNRSARLDFLEQFDVQELRAYLDRLYGLQRRLGQLLRPENRQELLRLLEPRCPLAAN